MLSTSHLSRSETKKPSIFANICHLAGLADSSSSDSGQHDHIADRGRTSSTINSISGSAKELQSMSSSMLGFCSPLVQPPRQAHVLCGPWFPPVLHDGAFTGQCPSACWHPHMQRWSFCCPKIHAALQHSASLDFMHAHGAVVSPLASLLLPPAPQCHIPVAPGPVPNDVKLLPSVPLNLSSSEKAHVKQAPRFQCPDCNRSYSTFSGLSKHRQFHCASHLKRQFSCKYCDKQYGSLGALKMHIRTHTLPCKCHLCGKAFSRPWLLQGHVRTHTGDKPFGCGHCGRCFADRSNLRAHFQTHSEIKKYRCNACQKTFSRMSLLTKHESNGCSGVSL